MDRTHHMFRKATSSPVRVAAGLLYWETEPEVFWLEGNGDLLGEVNDWLMDRQNYTLKATHRSAMEESFSFTKTALRHFRIGDEVERVEFLLRFSR